MAGMSGGHSRKGHTPSGSGQLAQGQERDDSRLRDSLAFKELGGGR